MGKVIVIASGKGGTGKTTLSANLSAAIAAKGKNVVAVDMDMGLRNLDVALGLESSIVYDVADVIEGNCVLDDALIKHPLFDSLFFIPAPQTRDASSIGAAVVAKNDIMKKGNDTHVYNTAENISPEEADINTDALPIHENSDENSDGNKGEHFRYGDREVQLKNIWKSFWRRLSERFDYCIIDSPAGIEGGFKYAAYGADSAILVTLAETAALRDADRVVDVLEDEGIEDIRLVINRIRPDMITKGIMMNIDTCIEMLEIPVLGIIGDDEELISSSLKGELAVKNQSSHAGEAIKNIASRVLGENIPIMEFKDNNRKHRLRKIISMMFKRKG